LEIADKARLKPKRAQFDSSVSPSPVFAPAALSAGVEFGIDQLIQKKVGLFICASTDLQNDTSTKAIPWKM